jgi:hypothetical protein
MGAIGRHPQRATDGAPFHHKRHGPERRAGLAHCELGDGATLRRTGRRRFDNERRCDVSTKPCCDSCFPRFWRERARAQFTAPATKA